MVKFFIENLLLLVLGLFILTQIVYPSFNHKVQYFWIFRKNGKKNGDVKPAPEEKKEETPLPEGFRYVEDDEVLPTGDYITRIDVSGGRTITNAPKSVTTGNIPPDVKPN